MSSSRCPQCNEQLRWKQFALQSLPAIEPKKIDIVCCPRCNTQLARKTHLIRFAGLVIAVAGSLAYVVLQFFIAVPPSVRTAILFLSSFGWLLVLIGVVFFPRFVAFDRDSPTGK